MSRAQIGYLIPLNGKLEEDSSVPKLSVSDGINVIGRNSISVSDKRLSRRHITLAASADGSASLIVEGSNPIVVNSGGSYLFKYETVAGERHGSSLYNSKRSLNNGSGFSCEGEENSRKRLQKASGNKSSIRNSEDNADREKRGSNAVTQNFGCSQFSRENNEQAIRNFHVPNDKIPLTFRLLLCARAATMGKYFLCFNRRCSSACPKLAKVPHVLVIHGESDGRVDQMKRSQPANWILHKPPLPISFGTHHSKAMLLVYPRGVRVIIHTANLIYVDWNNKSQGLWMQDFPWKDQNGPSKGSGFENDLIDYLSTLKWPDFSVKLPAHGSFNINPSFFKKFDYSNATVRLIASVPGYHTGTNMKKWGHMKIRSVLQECVFDKEFTKSPLIYQFSSLGSLDEKWMAELASSMSSGFTEDKTPLGRGEPQIIWPTVEDVRCSLEGYAAGNAIPSPVKNVEKEFLKKYWAKWKSSHTGRCRAMPHIKTYTRYNGQKLAWFLLTSANLSKAAWGALQKNNSQLMIRSYELGVLFLPSLSKIHVTTFSCTSNGSLSEENSEMHRPKLVTLTGQRSENSNSASEVIPLPVPYELPPQPYSSEDVPWSWDRRYNKKDVYGQVWPRSVQLYSSDDS
ncbi:Tyrosyl-DNA phosphodiesterase 1 [Quillaja saponaria]|uniref:Tyrosyl-DNA phosphodiesterase 1 n=1 Tax=Quillaja saponaria TaxID=32244 RepID=A0AAD7P922_QUISA|nr:Tyrosyl-DNA phosphodiesterase 1 [Quillaja saponaria]